MTFSGRLLPLQSSSQAERAAATDAAQAQAQARVELIQAQAEIRRAQAEARRAGIEAEIARGEATSARFSTGLGPVAGSVPSRRQENMIFGGFVILTVAAVLILQPLVRAFSRRFERSRQSVQMDPESSAQLQRIEHAVEAMAIEIERLSEGQRFTTKLLTKHADSESLINRG